MTKIRGDISNFMRVENLEKIPMHFSYAHAKQQQRRQGVNQRIEQLFLNLLQKATGIYFWYLKL